VNIDDVACRELVERITDLLDGRLSPAEHVAVTAHLAACPGCTAAVDQFRRPVDLLGHIVEDDVRALEPDVAEQLLQAFRDRAR
jgi:anti-sigma factor RsiW